MGGVGVNPQGSQIARIGWRDREKREVIVSVWLRKHPCTQRVYKLTLRIDGRIGRNLQRNRGVWAKASEIKGPKHKGHKTPTMVA
jgi:hypothetical protein